MLNMSANYLHVCVCVQTQLMPLHKHNAYVRASNGIVIVTKLFQHTFLPPL